MKKLVLTAAVAAAVTAPVGAALAQQGTPSPEHTVTGNLTITSDYRFRGLSQTFGEGFFNPGPAIQGGIDYSHASGFYVGNWNSNVSGNTFPNGAGIEMDFYGGWKGTFGDFGLDIGTIFYFYPGAKYPSTSASGATYLNGNTNNWEVYVGGTWKWFSAKYYYSFTDYFGLSEDALQGFVGTNPDNTGATALTRNGGTSGTQYLTASATFEVAPKLTLVGSLGYTFVANYSDLSYLDFKVGLNYDWSGWILGAAIIGTNADSDYWYACRHSAGACTAGANVREIGSTGLVLSVGKTF